MIDDEPNIQLGFRRAFRRDDLRVVTAGSVEEGLRQFESVQPDVVLLDLCLPDGDGLEAFRRMRQRDSRCLVIFITAHGTTETAIEATKEGAYDYLLKPLEVDRVREVVEGALRIRHMMHVPTVLGSEKETFDDAGEIDAIIGRCPAMQVVYRSVGRAAPQNVNVLILGESGTGKELVARALYQHSLRKDKPFLAVNCAAIPETLLESELFGHERGAFTGADRRRVGKFEQCDGGTLFLDEVGDMSLATQAKLLRVLQDRTFQPLGSNATLRTDVRIVAATNRDLQAMVAEGTFRMDLYYRLADFTIDLPPLRERPGDLALLVRHLLGQINREVGTTVDVVPPETAEILEKYPWPGNIRELQNVLRTALLHSMGPVLLPEFLPASVRRQVSGPVVATESHPSGCETEEDDFRKVLNDLLDRGEVDVYPSMIRRLDALVLEIVGERAGGNQVRMSSILGITRNTLRAKLRSFDEEPESRRA